MNTVTLIGRLGKNPELRYTANNKPVANFTIAVDNRHSDEPDWFNVVVWGRLAETVAEHKVKGDQVAVQGRLTPRSWETEDGQRRSTVEVTAEEIEYLARAKRTADSDGTDGQAA